MPPDIADLERTLGRHVRARRIDADLTQEELAERANISLSAVKGLEAGRGSYLSTLLKVSRVLGIQDWIERLEPPPVPFSPLDVLAQRRRVEGPRAAGPPRVRRARRR